MNALPIDDMPPEDLAIHLMTTGFAITGGEPAARRLLAELWIQWRAETTASKTLARVQDAAATLSAIVPVDPRSH